MFYPLTYTVTEGDNNVSVCVQIRNVPSGGLGEDVTVMFNAINFEKTG